MRASPGSEPPAAPPPAVAYARRALTFRRTILLLVVVAALLAGFVALGRSSGASERIVRAEVPGIGVIDGVVRPGTRVRPPARVPPAKPPDDGGRGRAAAASLAYEQAQPGDDSGPAADRAAVQRALKTKLFLLGAARACLRPPRA